MSLIGDRHFALSDFGGTSMGVTMSLHLNVKKATKEPNHIKCFSFLFSLSVLEF